jgi:hypothetical protein
MRGTNDKAIDWLVEQWPILEANIPPNILDEAREIERNAKKELLTDLLDDIKTIKKTKLYPGSFKALEDVENLIYFKLKENEEV